MKLVLSSGWSKESWAVKHSNQVLQDFRRTVGEIFVEMLSKYRFSDLSRTTNIKNEKINCTKRNPRDPFLEWSSISWNSTLSKISHRLSPLSRPILLHIPGSPCVWTTPCLLRSPYPAASTTGRLRKVQMTLQCWGGCVHWHQWKVDFAAGILQYMCLSWGLRSDGIIPLRIWGLKNNTVQDVAEFGILQRVSRDPKNTHS